MAQVFLLSPSARRDKRAVIQEKGGADPVGKLDGLSERCWWLEIAVTPENAVKRSL
jgi:hypothetical protein